MSPHPPALSAPAAPPDAEQIISVTQDVWGAFTGAQLTPVPAASADLAQEGLVGRVEVAGAWRGVVVLACTPGLARAAAAAMFVVPAEQVSAAEIADALGELTNMVGGNLKSVLPAPSRLALPSVRNGSAAAAAPAGASLVNAVSLGSAAGRLTIAVWQC